MRMTLVNPGAQPVYRSLDAEWQRLLRLMEVQMNQTRRELEPNVVSYSEATALRTIERLAQIVDDELPRLMPLLLRRKRLKRTLVYIDEMENMLYHYINEQGTLTDTVIYALGRRARELRSLVLSRRGHARRAHRRQRLQFWLPVAISFAALVVSVISLVRQL